VDFRDLARLKTKTRNLPFDNFPYLLLLPKKKYKKFKINKSKKNIDIGTLFLRTN